MRGVSKPVARFMKTLAQAFLSVRGRCNFRNPARYVPVCEHTLSRGFGRRFDFVGFARVFFELFLPNDTFVAALYTTFVTKSGKHTFGKDKFFSALCGKAIGGLELWVLALVSVEKKKAFSLGVRQSAAGLKDKLAFYAAQVEQAKDFLLKKTTILVADGLYAKQAFVSAVRAIGLHLVSWLRTDANLRWLYQGEQKAKGRPRKYAGKLDWADPTLWHKLDFINALENGTELYTAMVWSMCLKRRIRLAVLR